LKCIMMITTAVTQTHVRTVGAINPVEIGQTLGLSSQVIYRLCLLTQAVL